jgi:prevent-host-death family protein
MPLDPIPYSPYSPVVAKPRHRGAEEARIQLPQLLADAEKGLTTIITRHGRGVAALIPLKDLGVSRQHPLTALAGTGKGMWGSDSAGTIRKLRDEWKR